MTDNLAEIYASYNWGPVSVRPHYGYDYTHMDLDPFSQIHQAGLDLFVAESSFLTLQPYYYYQYRDFLYPINPPNDRDGSFHQVGAFQYVFFMSSSRSRRVTSASAGFTKGTSLREGTTMSREGGQGRVFIFSYRGRSNSRGRANMAVFSTLVKIFFEDESLLFLAENSGVQVKKFEYTPAQRGGLPSFGPWAERSDSWW